MSCRARDSIHNRSSVRVSLLISFSISACDIRSYLSLKSKYSIRLLFIDSHLSDLTPYALCRYHLRVTILDVDFYLDFYRQSSQKCSRFRIFYWQDISRQDICHLSPLDVEHFCEFNLVRFSPLPRAQ